MGKIAPLARSVLCKGLDLSEVSILASYFEPRSLAKGERLFSEGDPGQSLFFICDGQIQLKKERGRGAGQQSKLKEGEIFGELSLLQETERLLSAIAPQEAKVLVLERDSYVAMGREAPLTQAKFSRNILQILREKCDSAVAS